MSKVVVARPISYTAEDVRRVFGVDSLPVEHVTAPSIMIDGRFHVAGSRWLRRKYLLRPVEATVRSHADRLAHYIAYLGNERGLVHPDQYQSDVFAATEADIRAFYRARQFTPETAVSSATWRAQLSTIKQFHEFLREVFGLAIPFRVLTFTNPAGYASTTAPDLRPRTKVASSGTPITPGFAELLIQGAMRIDRDGKQTNSKTVERDTALISLGLGSGLRHGTLATITTYEIPSPGVDPWVTMRVPDFITKGDAGGDAFVFSRRLGFVHDYINNARAELIANGKRHQPDRAIHVDEADSDSWTSQHGGKARRYRWAETDTATRHRLVNPDGSSPIVWLNAHTPRPLSYDQVGSITTSARDWTREHILGDFPARFRTHDLRHTYATHLTVAIFKGGLSPFVHPDAADAYIATNVESAVSIAMFSLGHASETSTRLYVQHAHKLIHIPLEEFFGAPQ